MTIRLLTATLDNKPIAYTSESLFEVQVGRGKGSYKTKYSFRGNLGQAVRYYRGINIGFNYKKRLVCFSMNKPVLARQLGE